MAVSRRLTENIFQIGRRLLLRLRFSLQRLQHNSSRWILGKDSAYGKMKYFKTRMDAFKDP